MKKIILPPKGAKPKTWLLKQGFAKNLKICNFEWWLIWPKGTKKSSELLKIWALVNFEHPYWAMNNYLKNLNMAQVGSQNFFLTAAISCQQQDKSSSSQLTPKVFGSNLGGALYLWMNLSMSLSIYLYEWDRIPQFWIQTSISQHLIIWFRWNLAYLSTLGCRLWYWS